MDAARIVEELRWILARHVKSVEELRDLLAAVANRRGVAPLLIRTVASGDLVDARPAALALHEVRGEFVRRAVVKGAHAEPGERRALFRVACSYEELPPEVRSDAEDASGLCLLAINAPGLFVEWLAEPRRRMELSLVEAVESVRARYDIDPASIWAPFLARRCTPPARSAIHQYLGRVPGFASQALLESEERRAANAAEARSARREKMRQSLAVASVSSRTGLAWWRLGPGASDESLVTYEELPSGERLQTRARWRATGTIEWFSQPVPSPSLESGSTWTELPFGAVRGLIEAMPSQRRRAASPWLGRLENVPHIEVPRSVPTMPLDAATARALVAEEPFRDWRPLARMAGWTTELLSAGRSESREVWPPRVDSIGELAARRLEAHLAEPSVPNPLAQALRRFSVALTLRADSRAGAVASEAVQVARGRMSPVAIAFAEAEVARRLPWEAPLPEEHRAELRRLLRARLSGQTPSWTTVRLLDLAQAALEAMARETASSPGWPGLDDPKNSSLETALNVAGAIERLMSRVDDPPSTQAELLREVSRPEGASDRVMENVAHFAERACGRQCPVRCYGRRPTQTPQAVFEGHCPATIVPLALEPRRRTKRAR